MYIYIYISVCFIFSLTDSVPEAMLAYAWAESDKAGYAYKRKASGKVDVKVPIADWRKGIVEKALYAYKNARDDQCGKPQWTRAIGRTVILVE